MTPTVYLDYAATTPVDPRVAEAMAPFLTEHFGNANSLYSTGRKAAAALEDARRHIATSLGASHPDEIIFTSGGTESDNAALIGLATGGGRTGGHIIVSAFEHPAVLAPAEWLTKHGFTVTKLAPRSDGTIYPEDLAEAMRDDTILVSIMHANNEIGTLQPIQKLSAIAHEHGALFHTDAAQSAGKIKLDLATYGVDAATISAHKIYGPKGVGALYLRHGVRFSPYLMGGGQEFNRRSGTQNVAGAIGLASALELMNTERATETPRLLALQNQVITGILNSIDYAQLSAAKAPERLANIVNFVIPGVEGESMLLHLDAAGIAISTGSACSSGSAQPSHVLLAIGCPVEDAHGSLRVSLGRHTTEDDINYFLMTLAPIIDGLRAMNPLYEKTATRFAARAKKAEAGLYNETVMDHFTNPRNVGTLENPDGVGEIGDPGCGDVIKVTISVTGDTIKDIRCQTLGCGAAIATSSALTEMAKGQTLIKAAAITKSQIVDYLGGLPPIKVHCSVLATGALRKAIDDYLAREGREPICHTFSEDENSGPSSQEIRDA